VFELADALAHCGGSEMLALGRRGDGSFLNDGNEKAQRCRVQFHRVA